MLTFKDVVKLPLAEVKEHVVDCGKCPLNMACVIGEEGTGWHFKCCGSTAVVRDGELWVVDCKNNGFVKNEYVGQIITCPLCNGQIMEVVEREVLNDLDRYRYLPTVHAKVSLEQRIAKWRVVPETHT